ncbi:MAG TPA: cellulose synthase [Streptosporangiaceae bacterium]|nr:cellulose synthase [Streptosporangiaceae bacterium]
MNSWLSFVTGDWAGPIFVAVTVAGLVLSGLTWRRKGARSGIRGVAWSLLPAAAWLTHSLGLVGRIVSAVVRFAAGFVLSPEAWLGVILVGVSVLFFLVSGGIPMIGGRRRRKKKEVGAQGGRSGGGSPESVASSHKPAAVGAGDDDLADVRDILKKHGIS